MNVSVLIIAHNEAAHIKECIESVIVQSMRPDEIVLICHNCTDGTATIAKQYDEVKVVEYSGPDGVPYARIKGFETVVGDIVACIDGDSIAHKDWLKHITKPLMDKPTISLVAGYVILTNNLFARITSFWQFWVQRTILRNPIHMFAWGSNFACRKYDYEKVGGIAPIVELKDTLGLNFWAEDLYLSVALLQIGTMHVALAAKTYTTLPLWKIDPKTAPVQKWMHDNRVVLNYFNTKGGILK